MASSPFCRTAPLIPSLESEAASSIAAIDRLSAGPSAMASSGSRVAAQQGVEQPIARGLLGIALISITPPRHTRQHLGVDARHERRSERHLVGIEAIELRQAEARGAGNVGERDGAIALLGNQAEKGVKRLVPRFAHPASSLERRDAAANALSNTGWIPSAAMRIFNASAVVPPGLVTLTRNWCAGSLDRFSSSPLPATVARASCMAMSVVSPSLAPAAAIASTSRKT